MASRPPTWIFIVTALACIALLLFVDPIPQDPEYHQLADGRRLLGVPNFWNVSTNLPFLLAGLYGVQFVWRGAVRDSGQRRAWVTLFAGLILTSLGSAWYHWAPSNASLVWDRLPMTLGFAGFVTILIGECVSARAARYLLVPLLLAGLSAVLYWAHTESIGAGDLRPYAMVAVFPILMTPLILLVHRGDADFVAAAWWMILFYVLAKLAEHFDAAIYETLGFISGHSLKHLFAALSVVPLARLLRQRLDMEIADA